MRPSASILCRTVVIAVAVGLVVAFKAYAALSLAGRGHVHFIDDAFYYLLIARNFAQSGIPSFDGINPTNGFHPLWMLVLSAMYVAIGKAATVLDQLVAAKSVELIALAGALSLCVFAFHRLRGATPLALGFLGAALILLGPRLMMFEAGMESTLAAGLLLASIYAILDDRPRWLAASMPLLFLARLDTLVFVLGPLALWWAVRHPGRWAENARVFAPLAVVVAAYLGTNLLLTGQMNTISGQIKSSFPAITLHLNYFLLPIELAPYQGWRDRYVQPNVLVPTLGIGIIAALCAWKWREPWVRPIGCTLLIAALLVANVILFQRWDKGVEARYLALPYVLLGFAALATIAGLVRSVAPPAAAFGLLLLACAIVQVQRSREEIPMRLDFTNVRLVQSMTRPDELFAGTDVGHFAFILERNFVNLDGLANNRALQEAIRDRRLAEYFERQGIRYLLAAFWDREQTHASLRPERMYRSRIFPAGVQGKRYPHYDFFLYSYVFDAESDRIRFCPGDEIFRDEFGKDGIANAAIVIYSVAPRVRRAADDERCP